MLIYVNKLKHFEVAGISSSLQTEGTMPPCGSLQDCSYKHDSSVV